MAFSRLMALPRLKALLWLKALPVPASVSGRRRPPGRRLPPALLIAFFTGILTASLSGCSAPASSTAASKQPSGTVTKTDDNRLRLLILTAIDRESSLSHSSHISVMVENGIVLLAGQTPTAALSQQAGRIAAGQPGIRLLYNQLRLQQPTPLSVRTQDNWLSAKVKARLAKDDQLDDARIRVLAENSEIFLMGRVTSEQEVLAADITRHTRGVKRVVKAFESL